MTRSARLNDVSPASPARNLSGSTIAPSRRTTLRFGSLVAVMIVSLYARLHGVLVSQVGDIKCLRYRHGKWGQDYTQQVYPASNPTQGFSCRLGATHVLFTASYQRTLRRLNFEVRQWQDYATLVMVAETIGATTWGEGVPPSPRAKMPSLPGLLRSQGKGEGKGGYGKPQAPRPAQSTRRCHHGVSQMRELQGLDLLIIGSIKGCGTPLGSGSLRVPRGRNPSDMGRTNLLWTERRQLKLFSDFVEADFHFDASRKPLVMIFQVSPSSPVIFSLGIGISLQVVAYPVVDAEDYRDHEGHGKD